MGVSVNPRMVRQAGMWPALTAALFVLCISACEPPGKPGPSEIAPEDITDFKTLYEQNCSACHGPNGKNGPGRILNDPLYLAVLPRDTLRQVIQHGRPGTSMPAWDKRDGGTLSPKQIDALVNGIETNWAKPLKSTGAGLPSYTGEGTTGDVRRGQKLFLRDCFACHGPGAVVGTVTGGEFLSLVTDQVLRTSIIVGRPDLGMPDYRFLNLGRPLADQDISDLIAFLSSKRPLIKPQRVNDTGGGQGGATSKGNEGSGTGPGSPHQEKGEGNKSTGSSSLGGPK